MAGCATTNNQTADLTNKAESHQGSHGDQWLTDMEKAQALAKAQNKKILVFFTGSDWCQFCKILVEEVLSQQTFLDYAKDNLVLVELDFPTDEVEMSEAQKAHNEQWKDQLSVPGYPTVFLTDSSVNAYGLTGFQGETPQEFIEKLEKMPTQKTAVAELSAKIAKASGLEKAKLLDKLLGYNGEGVTISDVAAKEQEIISLAKGKDETLYNKYTTLKTDKAIASDVDALNEATQMEPAVEMLLEVHEKHKAVKDGGGLDYLLGNLGDCFINTKRPKEGLVFMDTIISDNSYSLYIRQGAQLYQAIIMYFGDESDESRIEPTLEMLEKTFDMDPESSHGKRAEEMIQGISQEAGI